jgi:hypothetical protein
MRYKKNAMLKYIGSPFIFLKIGVLLPCVACSAESLDNEKKKMTPATSPRP